MPSLKLTDAFVRNLTFGKAVADVCKAAKVKGKPPPAPTQVTYLDTRERGLAVALVVGASSKTFRALTYRNGQPHSIKLGRYPQMSVAGAWEKAREHFRDPKAFAAKAETGTFKQVAMEWIKRHVDENKLRSKREIERCLAVYVYPKWGEEKFLEIRRPQVNELLDWIVDHHGRSQADAVLAIVRGICNWYAANRSEHYVSPIVAKMKRDKRKPRQKARNRFLADDEIRRVWEAADAAGMFGAFVKIALLTGQRREKVSTMKWEDIQDRCGRLRVRNGRRVRRGGSPCRRWRWRSSRRCQRWPKILMCLPGAVRPPSIRSRSARPSSMRCCRQCRRGPYTICGGPIEN